MDRPEIVANRGYETFAEHYVNVGIKKGVEQERVENITDTKTVLREMGLSEEQIAQAQAKLEALQQSRLAK